MDKDFIGYVGPAELHDAQILKVQTIPDGVNVVVESDAGRHITLAFRGVAHKIVDCPVGMMLYALAEAQYRPPHRRYVFANADGEDTAKLEIIASRFEVLDGDQTGGN